MQRAKGLIPFSIPEERFADPAITLSDGNLSVKGGKEKRFPTSGNDRTFIIHYVVIPVCPESVFTTYYTTRN